MKRVFLIVLDSLGAGELPDAADYGDKGCHTLKSISKSEKFNIPNLKKLGMGDIVGLDFIKKTDRRTAAVGRLAEISKGKDTTIGHWEISGLYSPHPLPTYPNGFPTELLEEFSQKTGRGWLCNLPYSGTEVIKAYGEEHMKTGKLIIYTSADSVLQIAAHEEVVPLEELYRYCRIARKMMCGEHGVGRIIARPFVGTCADDFSRTSNRHDFSIEPPGRTVLDALKESGREVIAVGKINDIFVGHGITEAIPTSGNAHGMQVTQEIAARDFEGLCFVNLVDFDMLYGHRQDIDGYANALSEFDSWLGDFLPKLREDDVLIITADHGCDPGDQSTDHTREYIPIIIHGGGTAPINLGTRETFADIAATIADWFGVELETRGKSFANFLRAGEKSCGEKDWSALVQKAVEAMQLAYAPYSGYKVGAALLAKNGTVFTGCNIENAAFSPTNCAERTAVFKAVSEGVREFEAIAVVGGKDGVLEGVFPPCGVCRQVMMEFCDPESFVVVLGKKDGYDVTTLAQLLPGGFGKADMKQL